MKYNHLRLLRQLMDQEKSQRKILEYFQGEGYSESEIIGEINAYEQEQHASSELKGLPTEEFTMESAPELIPQKSTFPVKIILTSLGIIIAVLITVAIFLFL